ncbi:MAG: TrkH family potassium uptake protein [Pirellulaceae bacterium]|nr:TrkH family potassium uptake protein [Pirellulaceae bacterium]
MNLALLCRLLSLVAVLIGGCMAFSLPWAMPVLGGEWEYERAGFLGLLGSMAVCFAVGALLRFLGRDASGQLFRKEAMAVVGLSWVLAALLGALPYLFSGTHRTPDERMSPIDAVFEAQSGFTTTGATVLTELEQRRLVPRCILFWRSSTHFLGGLGIIVLFVAILGQGSAGKALMRAEMPGPSHDSGHARIQHTAWILFFVYSGLNLLLTVILLAEGLSLFDALSHAFGTMATGGFSTYNASVGHFAADPAYNGPLIEMTITLFMFLAGTNFMLLYALVLFRPKRLLADVEWRAYVTILAVVTAAVIGFGLYYHDFERNGMTAGGNDVVESSDAGTREPGQNEPETRQRPLQSFAQAVRFSLFQVVSIMTTTGYCTDDYDRWNSFGRGVLLILMFIGGCAGSTGGGLKVIRYLLFVKILHLEIEQAYHPSVVRPLRLGGQPIKEQILRKDILVYFGLILSIFMVSWIFTITVEPDSTWTDHGHQPEHKLIDAAGCVAATLNNIGPGYGVVGPTKNYANFSAPTKLLFVWLMTLGRLELFVVIVLLVPAFWRP